MVSPLVSFHSHLHQTYIDHVSERTSVAARSILRPDPLYLSEHSSERCPRASPLPPFKRGAYNSFSIRAFEITPISTPSTLAFLKHIQVRSTPEQSTNYTNVDQQNKNKDKREGESAKVPDEDTMAPKSGYYESSRSSSEGERVHYNPRHEDRERSAASNTKKRPVVVTYGGKTGDPARKAELDGKRWK